MAQPYSTGGYVAQGLGLCFMAWVIFYVHRSPENLSADVRGFDASPMCREDRVLSDVTDPPLDRPLPGECVIQRVTVANKDYVVELGPGSSRGPKYSITVLLPWGGQHKFLLRGDKYAYNSIVVGQSLNVLVFGQRIAFVAVNGRAISTSDDPDVDHTLQVIRWLGITLLLVLGLFSFYRAWRIAIAT